MAASQCRGLCTPEYSQARMHYRTGPLPGRSADGSAACARCAVRIYDVPADLSLCPCCGSMLRRRNSKSAAATRARTRPARY